VWESAISAADGPEAGALDVDHTTAQDEATPELTQVVGELGGPVAQRPVSTLVLHWLRPWGCLWSLSCPPSL
jgi:hypothetical protein